MEIGVFFKDAFQSLALPPGINFVLCLLALAFFKKKRTVAIGLFIFAFASLWILSLPVVSSNMLARLEVVQPLDSSGIRQLAAQPEIERAILVLSAGRVRAMPEYGGIDNVNRETLQRLQYASWLQRKTNYPVLVSGGSHYVDATPEAVLMNSTMTSYFSIAPRWIESTSSDLTQSAANAASILKAEGIQHILLVTHAWQMQRTKAIFEAAGLTVTSAPTAFYSTQPKGGQLRDYLPSAAAMQQSSRALFGFMQNFWHI